MSFDLDEIVASSRRRAQTLRERLANLRTLALKRLPTALALSGRFDIFAEVKLASPSEGRIASGGGERVAERAADYARAGAAAVSVLTEPAGFRGSLVDLDQAARATSVPVMRKDFIVDPSQVVEARAHGASGVLVMTRIVDDATFGTLLDACAEFDLFALVEAFDRDDLERTNELLEPRSPEERILLGMNARDLETLDVRLERVLELAASMHPRFPHVAESGLRTLEDVRRVARAGFSLALIGTSVMRAEDPGAAVGAFLEAGRSACGLQEARGRPS